MTQEALKLALDALEENHHLIEEYERPEYLAMYKAVIDKCKEALAQPEPCDMGAICIGCSPRNADGSCPSSQRSESSGKPSAWVGLTDVEIDYLLGSTAGENEETHISFARAIEAKLKERNT
jgi:hypothetical protein